MRADLLRRGEETAAARVARREGARVELGTR
jgi:hypothetical protein